MSRSLLWPSPLAGEGGGASPTGEGWHLEWANVSPLTRLAKPRHPLPQGERARSTEAGR